MGCRMEKVPNRGFFPSFTIFSGVYVLPLASLTALTHALYESTMHLLSQFRPRIDCVTVLRLAVNPSEAVYRLHVL